MAQMPKNLPPKRFVFGLVDDQTVTHIGDGLLIINYGKSAINMEDVQNRLKNIRDNREHYFTEEAWQKQVRIHKRYIKLLNRKGRACHE